jgi:hypothetical protein
MVHHFVGRLLPVLLFVRRAIGDVDVDLLQHPAAVVRMNLM